MFHASIMAANGGLFNNNPGLAALISNNMGLILLGLAGRGEGWVKVHRMDRPII